MKHYFDIVNANKIFGSIGRSGGGYCTKWSDWSEQGRIKRDLIYKEYEEGLNALCGHYEKLEESILERGILNPIVVTYKKPLVRSWKHIPPELINKDILIAEGVTGGSRLWVAQKHNLDVPVVINDPTETYRSRTAKPLNNEEDVKNCFYSEGVKIVYDGNFGFREKYLLENNHLHMNTKESAIRAKRLVIWVKAMNKHGYYVDRLDRKSKRLLAKARVRQKR